jgi:hypothetical protein
MRDEGRTAATVATPTETTSRESSERASAWRHALAQEVGAALRRQALPAFDQLAQVALTFAREGVEPVSLLWTFVLHGLAPECRSPPGRAVGALHVCWR